jgi:hypothetical protein
MTLEAQILLEAAPVALELGRMAIAAVVVGVLLAVGMAIEWLRPGGKGD